MSYQTKTILSKLQVRIWSLKGVNPATQIPLISCERSGKYPTWTLKEPLEQHLPAIRILSVGWRLKPDMEEGGEGFPGTQGYYPVEIYLMNTIGMFEEDWPDSMDDDVAKIVDLFKPEELRGWWGFMSGFVLKRISIQEAGIIDDQILQDESARIAISRVCLNMHGYTSNE